ncbi:MAG: mannitol dehydrogenase family protein [Oscillospiraceae bacterium]|nr:mannitol dehydrogenase family protein [Oscillospiraceae bacterium]
MQLTMQEISDSRAWTSKGYKLPGFDRAAVTRKTLAQPRWIHFGAGNIFRAFVAADHQRLLDMGGADTGIIVAEGYDYEIIDKAYRPYDNLALDVTLKADGSIDKTVVASIVESLVMDPERADWQRLKEIFRSPSLQMASFTITEKGYKLTDPSGAVFSFIEADYAAGPEKATSYIGKVAALCYERFAAGALPLSFVSMDNCSHNGSRLYEAVSAFADAWEKRGLAKKGFLAYVNDRAKVGFPWSMIDKITPRPDAKVIEMLRADGFENTDSVKTAKGTFVAPFVNAEETQYLIIEDWFPNGHPALDRVGVIFTARETVDKVEKMKVCTCLNPLHTALAVYGCLLGYTLISEEMKDPDLKKMVEIIGYKEGLPVVVNPGILDPKQFIDTVIGVRLPNVFMPDSPQRIATDTSQKLSIRFGETIKAYQASDKLDVMDLKLIPLVFAGWCRYVMGVDDNGAAFTPSDDPLLAQVFAHLKDIRLGDKGDFSAQLRPVLSNASIFGVDLYAAGLGARVEGYFAELVAGPGAVRATLHKYVNA